jgi:hypothetical protein
MSPGEHDIMPNACTGVMTWPIKALRIVAVKGSRCMITAVRNAPIHACWANDATKKIAVDASIEYQVVRRASAPTR